MDLLGLSLRRPGVGADGYGGDGFLVLSFEYWVEESKGSRVCPGRPVHLGGLRSVTQVAKRFLSP